MLDVVGGRSSALVVIQASILLLDPAMLEQMVAPGQFR